MQGNVIRRLITVLHGKVRSGRDGKGSKSGGPDFNDMLRTFRMMKKMEPLRKVLLTVPGMSMALPEGALDTIRDTNFRRIVAIILSMTPKERSNPDIIDGSRRRRIASGSGATVYEVDALICQLYSRRNAKR